MVWGGCIRDLELSESRVLPCQVGTGFLMVGAQKEGRDNQRTHGGSPAEAPRRASPVLG